MKDSIAKDRIAELADRFADRWRAGSESEFAPVAAQTLGEVDISPFRDTGALLRWVNKDPTIPPGRAGENDYGEPTITLYRSAGFRIEVIFWHRKPIAIHDHGSPGAFTALSGARLHNQYEFLGRSPLSAGIETGKLTRTSTELLDSGDVRQIHCLDRFIHSLFLLEPVCTSLAIRSQTRAPGQTRAYFTPGVAWSRAMDRHFAKHSETIGLLGALDPAGLSAHLLELASGPLESAVYALLALGSAGVQVDSRALAERIIERHGQSARVLLASAAQERRRRQIMQAVNEQSVSGHARLLLGLLWSATDLESAARIMRQRVPDRPPGDVGAEAVDEIVAIADGGRVLPAIGDDLGQAVQSALNGVLERTSDRDSRYDNARMIVARHPFFGSLIS